MKNRPDDGREKVHRLIAQIDHLMREQGVESWVLSLSVEADGLSLSDVFTSNLSVSDIHFHAMQTNSFVAETLRQVYRTDFVPRTKDMFDDVMNQLDKNESDNDREVTSKHEDEDEEENDEA